MKNFYFTLILFFISISTFSQLNPVQNLLWEYEYLGLDGENYALSWEEPESPHDQLIGYNIYRESELYRFQVETILFCTAFFDCNDDNGFPHYGNGESFYAHVTAVYEGDVESEYLDSVYIEKTPLNTNENRMSKFKIYPNPVQNKMYFESELKQALIYDLNGNLLRSYKKIISIDVADFPKSVYLIKAIKENDEVYEVKFIKE